MGAKQSELYIISGIQCISLKFCVKSKILNQSRKMALWHCAVLLGLFVIIEITLHGGTALAAENEHLTVHAGSAADCSDGHSACASMAASGLCKSAMFGCIRNHCRKSCKLCTDKPACNDSRDYCKDWASMGYCSNPSYAYYMHQNCLKSCGKC